MTKNTRFSPEIRQRAVQKDYLAEVANYSNDRWEAPQRASRLAEVA